MTTAVEYVEAALARIQEVEPRVQALLPEPDRAARLRSQAGSCDPGLRLSGIPVGVKDIVNVDGFDTRAGSRLPPATFAGPEAAAAGRLRTAGALILGKTVTTEFAYRDAGPTTNPHNPAHTPGGSSSGSAAAVAAGYTPLAIGTQTIDSIITPAAFCGVVGYMPSFGRVPADGVVPFSPSMDRVGVLAEDVAMAAVAAGVLCDDWSPSHPADPVKLGVPSEAFLAHVEPEPIAQFRRSLQRLSETIEVTEVSALTDIEEIAIAHRALVAFEFAVVHESWFEAHGDLYRPNSIDLVMEGREVAPRLAAGGLASSLRLMGELAQTMDRHGLDAWIGPSTTGPAPAGTDSQGDVAMGIAWTHAHLPAITLPAGASSSGLPLGLQLVGRPGGDEVLLAVAEIVEELLA